LLWRERRYVFLAADHDPGGAAMRAVIVEDDAQLHEQSLLRR